MFRHVGEWATRMGKSRHVEKLPVLRPLPEIHFSLGSTRNLLPATLSFSLSLSGIRIYRSRRWSPFPCTKGKTIRSVLFSFDTAGKWPACSSDLIRRFFGVLCLFDFRGVARGANPTVTKEFLLRLALLQIFLFFFFLSRASDTPLYRGCYLRAVSDARNKMKITSENKRGWSLSGSSVFANFILILFAIFNIVCFSRTVKEQSTMLSSMYFVFYKTKFSPRSYKMFVTKCSVYLFITANNSVSTSVLILDDSSQRASELVKFQLLAVYLFTTVNDKVFPLSAF